LRDEGRWGGEGKGGFEKNDLVKNLGYPHIRKDLSLRKSLFEDRNAKRNLVPGGEWIGGGGREKVI